MLILKRRALLGRPLRPGRILPREPLVGNSIDDMLSSFDIEVADCIRMMSFIYGRHAAFIDELRYDVKKQMRWAWEIEKMFIG